MALDQVTTGLIKDDAVTTTKIVNDAVTAAKIPAGAVVADIAADSVTASHLHTNAVFASGTKMIFNQTAAPTGWTKVTGSGNDTALRVTTGTVGTGGTVAFETAFASQTPTITMSNGAVTLTTAQMPSHLHATWAAHASITTDGSGTFSVDGSKTSDTDSTGGGGSHTHTNTAASSALNLDVSYLDVIIATKD